MEHAEMVKSIWSLANIITGFAVAQGLAFAFALGKDLAHLQRESLRVKFSITALSVFFALAYSLAVHRCQDLAVPFDESHEAIWKQVTNGRIACIWLFTGVGVFGLFALEILERKSHSV
jgi:hypothetical protein